MLRAAVIGIGSMGKNHVRVLSDLNSVELVCIADSNETVLKAISAKYHVKGYTDYRKMLEKEKLDIVSIVVPTTLHKQVSLDVIEKGIHCLLEKPIAATIADSKEIIEKAKEKKVKLMIGHIERFNPAVIELKKRLPELGEIYKIVIERVGPFPARISDVGVVLDLSVHDLDIINYILGSKPVSIFAETQNRIHPNHEDTLTSVIKYKDNVIAVLNIDWLTPTKKRQLTITGRKGMFKVNYLLQEITFYENKALTTDDYGFLGVTEGNMTMIQLDKKEPLKQEIESFIDCVMHNRPSPITGEDGMDALLYAQKILESAKEENIIRL
jgi:UDP-N-acetylglucosamine 3-dehydrogenase